MVLFSATVQVSRSEGEISRTVFNILDVIGQIGGLLESTSSLFLFLVSPIAKHSFLLKAIQALYLIKLKA
jgi:hypothetical protein